MIAVTIIAVGKIKDKRISAIIDDYKKMMSPYVRLKIIEVPAAPFSKTSIRQAQIKDEEAIMDRLESLSGKEVFILSEDGRQLDSSKEFSGIIDKVEETVFVVGGASGFSPGFKDSYKRLSLSPLTFTHEMARLLLLEQIYRAATISIGKDYHY